MSDGGACCNTCCHGLIWVLISGREYATSLLEKFKDPSPFFEIAESDRVWRISFLLSYRSHP
jgi:hypothetical protein